MHIELRRWADVFVIAPLSANTLAKIANVCHRLPPGPVQPAVSAQRANFTWFVDAGHV